MGWASANYVSANGATSDISEGGFATDNAAGTGTVQLGWVADGWTVAAIYSQIQNGHDSIAYATPFTPVAEFLVHPRFWSGWILGTGKAAGFFRFGGMGHQSVDTQLGQGELGSPGRWGWYGTICSPGEQWRHSRRPACFRDGSACWRHPC